MSYRIGIVGASGSGKTTKALELIKPLGRVVLMSPFPDDYASLRPVTCDSMSHLTTDMRRRWHGGFKLMVKSPYGDEAERLEEVSALILHVQQNSGGTAPITLVVDELNTAFPVHALPRALKSFGELCSRGRHYNVSIIGITQRLAEVSTRWRGNMTGFYAFRPADATDAQTVARMLPMRPKAAAELAALENFQFLYVQSGRAMRGQVKRPRG